MGEVRVFPSLLAADLANLATEVHRVEPHVDGLHLDVMDGHFVPNITFGMPVIAALRAASDLYFDCHLMTTNPDDYVEELASAGADLLTMHIEAIPDPTRAAKRARDAGLGFGLVLNPGTPFEAVIPFLELCDLVLVMSVEPGFGGQHFVERVLPKIEAAREWVESEGLAVDIEVDGGVTPATAVRACQAGANILVAGTAVFGAADAAAAVTELRQAARKP